MRNKLIDLNNHLFAQLERLGDESLEGEKLSAEVERSKAITIISKQVIDNARLALDAKVTSREFGTSLPEMIEHSQASGLIRG
ncbi:hypothetical protein ACN08N_23745 [Photobacterium leiognathi subsp. mandapamensis]|uniref:hypothetical protein n=1 Tax=Photobacterium leiognathi TaxID=553611 RepID=UPI003AF3D718